ncbi:MAG: hypothetical protein ACTSQZ_03495 [Candidatus Thorarchaeota archaeon]
MFVPNGQARKQKEEWIVRGITRERENANDMAGRGMAAEIASRNKSVIMLLRRFVTQSLTGAKHR